MKAQVLAAVLMLGSAGLAVAADQSLPMEQPPAGFDWTGAYVGAHIGYGWANSTYSNGFGEFTNYDPDGILGGLYGGFNYQLSNGVLVGIEADISASDVDTRSDFVVNGFTHPTLVGVASVKHQAALRARLGYAFERWLPYVAAGVSYGRYEFGLLNQQFNTYSFRQEESFTGWTVGAGLEFAATDNILIRADYRFSDLGDWRAESWAPNEHVDLKANDIRLGIAYKF